MRLLILFLFLPFAASAEVNALWFNSGMNNRDVTFSPDGTTMLTSILTPRNGAAVIAISRLQDGTWSPLEVAPFSGQHMDIEPAFSPAGDRLLFASRRPKPDRDGTDWDIWQVGFSEGRWGEPQNLGPPVNTPGNEFYPSVAASGNLYFTATRDEGEGGEDIFVALPNDGRYDAVKSLGPPVNSQAFEFNAFIAADESWLLFGAQGRPGETGGGDIYISYRVNGQFGEPRLLSAPVNSARLDYCPTVFNNRLYFTSERIIDVDLSDMTSLEQLYESPGNGLGDVYWIPFDQIHD